MGPDFLDRQSIWYKFCCNLICLLFLIQSSFSSRISGRISGKKNWPDIRLSDFRPIQYPQCNPKSQRQLIFGYVTRSAVKSMWTAIYDYEAQGEDELTLTKGDEIEVSRADIT